MAERLSISLVGPDRKVIDSIAVQSASQDVGELRRIAAASSGIPLERVRLYLRAGAAVRELAEDSRTLGDEIGAALPPLAGSPARGAKVRTRVGVVQKLPGLYDASQYDESVRGRPEATIPVGTVGTVATFEFGLATVHFRGFAPQVWGEQELVMLTYEPAAGFSIEVRGDDRRPTEELAVRTEGPPAGSFASESRSLLARLSDAVKAKDKRQLDRVLTDMSQQADIDMKDFEDALMPLFKRDSAAEAFFQSGVGEYAESAHLRTAHNFSKTNIYFCFRAMAMHYGPSLRPIQASWQHGSNAAFSSFCQGTGATTSQALAVMKDDTIETWEERALFQAQAGLLDGALQAQTHMGGNPLEMLKDPVTFFKQYAAAAEGQA